MKKIITAAVLVAATSSGMAASIGKKPPEKAAKGITCPAGMSPVYISFQYAKNEEASGFAASIVCSQLESLDTSEGMSDLADAAMASIHMKRQGHFGPVFMMIRPLKK